MKTKVYSCCLILSALASHGADFDLGNHGTLSVTVPGDWSASGKAANRPDGTPIYNLAFNPRSETNAKCLLTFAYFTNSVPDRERIRKEVLRITKRFVPDS